MACETAKKKDIIKKRKENVKNNLSKTPGILVDTPLNGYGSSNTGSIMIKFFHSYEITSKITEIDQNIIKRVYIILNTLNSGYIIDAEKYKCYAIETAKIYIKLYPWYYMPVFVHKM